MKKIPTEIYDRSVGYYRPTSQMHKAKQEEQSDRARAGKEQIINITREADNVQIL